MRWQTSARSPRISGPNQLQGTVVEVTIEGLMARVVLAVGSQRVTSMITADGARELALKPAETAFALIKATGVIIARS